MIFVMIVLFWENDNIINFMYFEEGIIIVVVLVIKYIFGMVIIIVKLCFQSTLG